MFSKATVLLALAASASAHMTLNYPVPYGKATLNSSPLVPGDWPCKQRTGVYEVSEMNQWNAGETKEISFTGSAVHGGGSCQFSLTTDSEPTEASQWKVIHSVVGGCPSNVSGNLPDNEKGSGAAIFPVTMPESVPDGLYTFAWTWLNKVGNREFYMNCAPVQVGAEGATASSANAGAALAALPDMFVANLPDTSCTTKENEDFNYPEPGQSLVDGASADLGDTLSGAGCAAMTKMGAGSGSGTPTQAPGAGSSAPAATQPAASAPVASAPVASAPVASAPVASAPAASAPAASPPAVSAPGYSAAPVASASPVVSVPGIFAPGASSAPAASAPAATPAPVASAAPAPPAASAAPVSPPTGGDCTPCTNDGAVVCIGTSSFGLCNRGCAVAQQLAAGMACTDGSIVAAAKRSFPRAHLHKRHGAGLRLR
ncbi:hypothetical protein C7974DRAFT_125423 [Boeremia exigua]|uniref:uncharacterized protein n=1 Tax=Boeremia exigua TaxID=749465 RepID=UPI001E8ED6E0|nr:uncharacterized protein C7974DRAFT_125423 [Boeremia exigua]KAH6639045.1 hypothetical protein C7974DRAFT_125423 [Boeremia exigua]